MERLRQNNSSDCSKPLAVEPHPVLFPLPCALLTTSNGIRTNIDACSWIMPINLNPPMIAVSIRPDYPAYADISSFKEFGAGVVPASLHASFDKCIQLGERSSESCIQKKVTELSFEFMPSERIKPPFLKDAIASLECCFIRELWSAGSHRLLAAEVLKTHFSQMVVKDASAEYLNKALSLQGIQPLAFVMGEYWSSGKSLGKRSLNRIDIENDDWNPRTF